MVGKDPNQYQLNTVSIIKLCLSSTKYKLKWNCIAIWISYTLFEGGWRGRRRKGPAFKDNVTQRGLKGNGRTK